jgi:hypothetical protein
MKSRLRCASRLLLVMAGLLFTVCRLFAEGLVFSGFLDSKITTAIGAGSSPDFSFGIEEYANLRMQAKIRDRAVFYGAFNLIAASGSSSEGALATVNPASTLPTSSYIAGENYIAAMELERLYFRLNSEFADVDAGLMRLAFGYGQVFGPSDFLNPRNPLFPDLRPRGILGSAVSAYPTDSVKLLAFAAAPQNPFNSDGSGLIFGISGEKHWAKASVQGLYTFETPQDDSSFGIHRGGLSFKADLLLSFVGDMLYTYNHDADTGTDGFSASAGLDYSFLDGDLYLLSEYLYNGSASATAASKENLSGFSKGHYLYAMLLYNFSDYTNVSLACMTGLEDASFVPIVTFEHDIFQGMTLTITGRVPLDRDAFADNGETGEFGPENTRQRFNVSAKVRLRF